MTTTWVITRCDRLTSDGFIQTAHWVANATDGEYTASVYSTCSFAEGVATTPYVNVTEQDVLGWCWANGVDKEVTEAALAANIALQKNPVTATGTPWSA